MKNMSKYAKSHKGRARADALPIANDWLYTSPEGLSTSEIVAVLGVVGQPVTEVSAHSWQQDWQMANTFMDAYGYPISYRFPPGKHVNWDAFNDWMLVKQSQSHRNARGRMEDFRFVGELVIVRASREATEDSLAFLLDIVQTHVDRSRNKSHSQARILLVLEGWERPTVAGRVIGTRVAWSVNPMPLPRI